MERYLRVNLLGPGPGLMKKEFTGPRSHKGWETLVYSTLPASDEISAHLNRSHCHSLRSKFAPAVNTTYLECNHSTSLGVAQGRDRSVEPMARGPRMTRGKISLARGIHCCPVFFISFALPASLYCDEYIYIYIYIYTRG